MNEAEIKKFERHLGKSQSIKLKNDEGTVDEFTFEPLPVDFLPDMMRLSAFMSPTPEENKVIKDLQLEMIAGRLSKEDHDAQVAEISGAAATRAFEDKEKGELFVKLIDDMVIQSYPEEVLPKDIRRKFVYNNVMDLMFVLIELNEAFNKSDKEIMNKVDTLRGRVQQGKKA